LRTLGDSTDVRRSDRESECQSRNARSNDNFVEAHSVPS
jgi:hypothetical protein